MNAKRMVLYAGLLCVGTVRTTVARAEPIPEVNRTVEVYDREDRFSVDPTFQVPPGNPPEWAWRLTAEAVGNWVHIPGTQMQEGGDGWDVVDFSERTGYWRMLVVSANEELWRHFQGVRFSGDLRPLGPGTRPYIGSFTIEAGTDTDYFLTPESEEAVIGTPVTITAREPGFPDPVVDSTWEIAPDLDSLDPPPATWTAGPSITFAAGEPGVYLVTGTNRGNPEQTATATVMVEQLPMTLNGEVQINPNNSPQGAFFAELPDGTQITGDDLQAGFEGYEGPARHVHLRPMGGGTQTGLRVNGAPYTLYNNQTYDIISPRMTVRIWNDHVNPQGRAVGQWWIGIHAEEAVLNTSGGQ